MSEAPIRVIKGRGTAMRPQPRYDRLGREAADDGWDRRDPEHGPGRGGGRDMKGGRMKNMQ